ncbi:hypothetical protein [Streptomyces pinistramenti]|uniref:hypothetical protein n=1 Tax=Streptomyces pinistramenti TaxID=2884812 RepID=UPI001D08C29E|nr:hypothetical protein [Streptomyces pinistramenti]MCB5911770.1 hypothetical protein [Streptomyces pinistramenti]
MTSRRRTASGLTALTCSAALLAGGACAGVAVADDSGGEGDLAGKTAQQISDLSRQELLAATSLRLRTLTSVDETKLDLSLDRSGNCTGTLSKGAYGRVDIVKHGKQIWMKPDDAFWKGQLPADAAADIIARVKGRYLRGTTSDTMLSALSAPCDLAAFQKQTAGSGRPQNTPSPGASPTPQLTLSKGKPTVQEGTRVLPILKKRGPATQTLYVAIEGKHYPRRLTTEVDHQSATLLLSNYGAPVPSATPSPADSIAISTLKGKLPGESQGSSQGT